MADIVNKLQQLRAKGTTPGAPAAAGLIGQIAFNKNGNYDGDPREAMYVFDEDPSDSNNSKWRTVFEGADSIQQHTVLKVQEIRMDDPSKYNQKGTIEEASDKWFLANGGSAGIYGNTIIGYFGNNTYILAIDDGSTKHAPSTMLKSLKEKDSANPMHSRAITTASTEFKWLKLSNKALVIGDNPPVNPSIGSQWLSLTSGKTSTWIGTDWVCFPGPLSDASNTRLEDIEKRLAKLEGKLKGGTP